MNLNEYNFRKDGDRYAALHLFIMDAGVVRLTESEIGRKLSRFIPARARNALARSD